MFEIKHKVINPSRNNEEKSTDQRTTMKTKLAFTFMATSKTHC